MAAELRRRSTRAAAASGETASTAEQAPLEDGPAPALARSPSPDAAPTATVTFRRAFLVILVARVASAALNLVHDCDETFNFWFGRDTGRHSRFYSTNRMQMLAETT
jgi:hypothetical protein